MFDFLSMIQPYFVHLRSTEKFCRGDEGLILNISGITNSIFA